MAINKVYNYPQKNNAGFTLAELLIALGILGIIAIFTIPKIISAQNSNKDAALVKEAASTITGAYQAYKNANGGASTGAGVADLTPYINYVRFDTTSPKDGFINDPSEACSNAEPCLLLANGALLNWEAGAGDIFGGSASNNAIWIEVDPVAGVTGPNSPQGVVELWLYYNGKITSRAFINNPTCNNGGCLGPNPAYEPPWFKW